MEDVAGIAPAPSLPSGEPAEDGSKTGSGPAGDGQDMLSLLQDIALGRIEASAIQVRAAIAAVQYTHAKIGEGGKKEERQRKAEKAAGKFAPAAPPRLVASGGRSV